MHGVGGEVRFFLPWVPVVKLRLSGGAISLSLFGVFEKREVSVHSESE